MTATAITTMRERMTAVLRGEPVDRVPFVTYDGLGVDNEAAWALVGRDQMGLLRWTTVHRLESPHGRFEHQWYEADGRRRLRTTLHTPAGSLTEDRGVEPVFNSSAVRDHFVRHLDDWPVLLAHLRDTRVVRDEAPWRQTLRELGDDGLAHLSTARTPWQQLWVQWVSLSDLSLHAADAPDLVHACLSELGRIQHDILAVIAEVARDNAAERLVSHVVFPDNITAPAIGPERFRTWCVPFYDRAAELLERPDVPVFVHMDGDLQPLTEAIAASRVGGIDSLSPPPDNDTSPARARAVWPELILWANFPSSVHLAEPTVVYETARELLRQGGERFWIQISENVPPFAWRTSYPAIVRAINDAAGEARPIGSIIRGPLPAGFSSAPGPASQSPPT